jgi:hypothetical protein
MPQSRSIRAARRARLATAAVTLLALTATAPGHAASPDPGAAPGPFASTVLPFTMALPADWTARPAEPVNSDGTGEELFDGPSGASARVGTGVPGPSDTVADRVALNRGDLVTGACTSDATTDRESTLGGEAAIAWSYTCPDQATSAINTLHDGLGYRLSVSVPATDADTAASILESMRTTFAFTSAPADIGPLDLAGVAAQLEGTWQTDWRPVELERATLEAAGLDPADGDPGFAEYLDAGGSDRMAVKFEDGTMTQYEAHDGGPYAVGWRATFDLLDPTTLHAVETGRANEVRYRISLADDVLAFDVASTGEDLPGFVVQTAFFETLPFTKVPLARHRDGRFNLPSPAP